MITTGAKFWLAVTGLAVVAAVAYVVASDGEWFGTFVLGSLASAALVLGLFAAAMRDGDAQPGESSAGPALSRSLPAGWPALGAVGAGVAIVGMAGRNDLLWVGVGILGIVAVEWMVQGWAERATADPLFNRSLRSRIMSPIEIPVLALVVIAAFLLSLSRVLLALPEHGSTVTAMAVATFILLTATAIAARPRVGSSVLAGLLALGAVALIAGGIAGGVHGERTIEKHETPAGETTTTTIPGSNGY